MLLNRCCRLLFCLALLVVLVLALMPAEQVPVTSGWDKANHVLAFFVLLWLCDYGWPSAGHWYWKVGGLLLYALLIEVLQLFTGDRWFSLLDVGADIVGLMLYGMLRPWLFHRLRTRLARWQCLGPELS